MNSKERQAPPNHMSLMDRPSMDTQKKMQEGLLVHQSEARPVTMPSIEHPPALTCDC